jgi:hypothetical protein
MLVTFAFAYKFGNDVLARLVLRTLWLVNKPLLGKLDERSWRRERA